MTDFVVFTDGGSRGNPGPSAGGWVVYEDKTIIAQGSEYFGVGTNNQAEYKAVIAALEWIKSNLKVNKIVFYLDSELVVKQLNGVYKIKDSTLQNLAGQIKKLKVLYSANIVFKAVPRELNKIADQLVNIKLDEFKSA